MANPELKNYTHPALTKTSTSASAASVTATVDAEAQKRWAVIGFSGGSSDQSFKVEIKFGSTVKWTHQGGSGTTTGFTFPERTMFTDNNESLSVVVTPSSTGQCSVNLIYMEY